MADKRKAPTVSDAARKRKAPTIDLTATEVTPPAAAEPQPDVAAEPQPDAMAEPQPEPLGAAPAEAASEPSPPPPPLPPEEPPQAANAADDAQPAAAPATGERRPLPLAATLAAGVAGGAGVAVALGLAWYAGLVPANAPARTDMQAKQQLDALQQQVEALRNRPAPAPAIDAKSVDALGQRVTQLETTLRNLPKTGGPDPQLGQKLTDLQTAITPLSQRLAAVESALKSGDTAVAALGKRIDDIAGNAQRARTEADAADKAVTQLQSKMQDLARNEASTVTRADIDALQQKLAGLEQAEKAARTSVAQSAAATAATRLALAAQALRNAVARGAPYRAELAQAKALGADATKLAPLEPFAADGIPGTAALAQQLHALLPEMQKIAAPRAEATGSFLERLQANAGNLVRVSPVNAPAGDAPADVLARLEVETAHNDIAAAAADIGKLPEAAQAPAKAWLARVKTRQAALAAANDLAASTARALTPGAQ